MKYKPRKAEREFGKKLYSVAESYWIFYNGIRTMKYMYKAKRNKELSKKFIERIMLAVTEVNNCALCSHAHTKKALESGMSCEEIQKLLSGIIDDVPADQVTAVLFAQHYADTRGNPTMESWAAYCRNLWDIQSKRHPWFHSYYYDRKYLWYSLELLF